MPWIITTMFISFSRVRTLSLFVMLSTLSGVETYAQTIERTDSLPAAIKEATTARQIAVSERIVLHKDYSMIASPAGEGDHIKLIQTLPGVAIGSDGSSSYFVRGGDMGGNVQTLDGVPIYGYSHLIGLTSAYPSEVIESARFLVGGFSSEEGNISSSHINLRSKDGSYVKASGKLGISNLLIGAVISTPLVKDKLSLSLSVRYSPASYEYKAMAGLFDRKNVGIQDFDALIYDAFAKIKYKVRDGQSLSLSAFRSTDRYNFITKGGSEDKMSWDNTLAIVQYDAPWMKRGTINITGSFNHYGNAQGMLKQMGQTLNNLQIRSLLNEGMVHAMAKSPVGDMWMFQYGLKARVAFFNPGSSRILESGGLYPQTSSPMADRWRFTITGTVHGQVEYGNSEDRLFRLASRLNYNNISGIAPEASLRIHQPVYKSLGIELTADYLTRFYHTLEGIPLGWSLDMIVPTSEHLKPEHTMQFYAGLYSGVNEHHFSVGAYYKRLWNLVFFSDASKLFDSTIAGWEDNIEVGGGTSKGLEVMYEKTGETSNWRLSYTLSKTDRLFPNLNGGKIFPAKYDRTHILNASAQVRLLERKQMNLSMASFLTLQSGHMETVHAGSYLDNNFVGEEIEVLYYTTLNNYRMPTYIRWDISALFEFCNSRHQHTLNVGVYNVLNRHNPFCLSYDSEKRQWKQISLLPLMPSLRYAIAF